MESLSILSKLLNWNLLLMLGILAMSTIVRAIIMRAYNTYSATSIDSGMTGRQAAQLILERNYIFGTAIYPTPGVLKDSYNRKSNSIALSEDNYNNSSIAAVAIAAHEVGHALQVSERYTPMTFLVVIKPVVRIASMLFLPLLIISAIASSTISSDIILYIFIGIFAFQLLTLPVEFNASGRALAELRSAEILTEQEVYDAKKMLRAAALTYVASTLTTFLLALRMKKR